MAVTWKKLAYTSDNQIVTISDDVATVTGPGKITLCAEAGVEDDLDQIVGLSEGEEVTLEADAGDTITVKDGAKFDLLRGLDFVLTGKSKLRLICDGVNSCSEESRSSNQ